MLNFSKIKILLIYLIFLSVSIFCISNFIQSEDYFFKKKINLGLDLQGGSYLLLEVDSSPLQKRHLQAKVIPLKKKLIENKINFENFKINEKDISFEISENNTKKFEKVFTSTKDNKINTYLDKYRSFELDYELLNNKIVISLSKNGIINSNFSVLPSQESQNVIFVSKI